MDNESLKQKVLAISVFLILFVGFILIFSPFWMPILCAGVFALGIHPMIEKLQRKYHLRRKTNPWIFFGTVFFFIFVPSLIFISRSVNVFNRISEKGLKNSELYGNLAQVKNKFFTFVSQSISAFDSNFQEHIEKVVSRSADSLSQFILTASSDMISAIPSLLLAIMIFYISLYLFLKFRDEIKQFVLDIGILRSNDAKKVIAVAQDACATTLVSSVIVGLVQALVVSIAAGLMGAGDFWLVFIITFFMSFIPAIGAGPVSFILSLPFWLNEDYLKATGLVIVAIVAGTIDNIMRPYLVSSSGDVHPFITFLASVGGIIIFGIPGLFIGPVIAVIFIKISPIFLKNIFETNPKNPV